LSSDESATSATGNTPAWRSWLVPKPKTGVLRQTNGLVALFVDPAAAQAQFTIPFPGSGASRNVLRGQGCADLDVGLSKRWRILLNQVRFNAQGVGSTVTSILQAPTQFGT
jgi:hypothetical protein